MIEMDAAYITFVINRVKHVFLIVEQKLVSFTHG